VQASLALNPPSPADEVIACNAALAAWNTARSQSSQAITSAITLQQAGANATGASGSDVITPVPAVPR